MQRPSFQFYPADWLGNSNLRRCTHAEKGAWVDVMCLMHDAPEYGILRWPLSEIAQAVGCNVDLLHGLIAKDVMKGSNDAECDPYIFVPRHANKDGDPVTLVAVSPGPIWYSTRMVRDEYKRKIRGAGSRFGSTDDGVPKPTPEESPIPAPKPHFGDGASSSSSSSCKPSVSKDTGAVAPPADSDPIFGFGLDFLKAKGNSEKSSRSFLALMRKNHGDSAVMESLSKAERDDITNPIPWIKKVLESHAKPGNVTGRFDPVAYVNRNRTSRKENAHADDSANVIDGTAERVA